MGMGTSADILHRKETHFVLWRPGAVATAPQLIIGELRSGNPPKLANQMQYTMAYPGFGTRGHIAIELYGLIQISHCSAQIVFPKLDISQVVVCNSILRIDRCK
jgi:hypothetical protein